MGARRAAVIWGEPYRSCAEAARATGVSYSAVLVATREGRGETVGRGVWRGTPCVVRGRRFASMAQAGRELGIDVSTVFRAIEQGREATAGLGGRAPMPVEHRGRRWPSGAALARELGVWSAEVSYARRRPGFGDWIDARLRARGRISDGG